jgi:predicted  nucleic acid-binding Zn-ribbon protein
MRRACFFVLATLLIPPAGFCQSKASDSQTLQALLSEVRELRQELHSSLAELEAAKNEEAQRQTAEIDAEQQLRTEQNNLDTLQAQLDEIVKELDNAGVQSGSAPH